MSESVEKHAFCRKGTASTKTQTSIAGHFQGMKEIKGHQGNTSREGCLLPCL